MEVTANEIYDRIAEEHMYATPGSYYYEMVLERLSVGKYMVLIRKNPDCQSPDEWASVLGITVDELMTKIQRAEFKKDRKTTAEKEQDMMEGWADYYALQESLA